jgi:hypothetical protein
MTELFRIVRGLGGNGSTYICRALAAMERIVLLSETNPSTANLFAFELNPATQIEANYLRLGLPTYAGHAAELGSPHLFGRYVAKLNEACNDRGHALVIRDYNYVDYIGVPLVWSASGKSSLDAALGDAAKKDVLLLRHPIPQFLSLTSHRELANALDMRSFLRGYRRMLDVHADALRFKYELVFRDFETQFGQLVSSLALPYDDSYKSRLPQLGWMTGHEAGKSLHDAVPPDDAGKASAALLGQFRRSRDYREICSACDYDT